MYIIIVEIPGVGVGVIFVFQKWKIRGGMEGGGDFWNSCCQFN